MRLQKYLADCGVASRRHAEKLILAGEIKVNNRVVTQLGTSVTEGDEVKWQGKVVRPLTKKYYVMLNKPAGYICSCSEYFNRDLVIDLLEPPLNKIVKPVGRLDYNSTGLLLFSNDGEFIKLMTHPTHKVVKKYRVKVRGEVTTEKIARLKTGLKLEDGWVKAQEAKLDRQAGQNAFLMIAVVEGRNHLIKRMCQAIGLSVVKLGRVSIGPLTLKGLKLGEYRLLDASEVEMLKGLAS